MDKKTISEILKKNPNIDKDLLEKTQDMIKELRNAGIRSHSVASQPPTDPYSSSGKIHAAGKLSKRTKR